MTAQAGRPPAATSAMNSRRFMSGMGTSSPYAVSAPLTGWQVLGADLNCSESRCWRAPQCASSPEQDSIWKRLDGELLRTTYFSILRISRQARAEHLE